MVRYRNWLLQVENGEPSPWPGSQVTVCEYRDGSLHLFHGSQELRWREIAEGPQPAPVKQKRPPKPSHWEPPSDHPWRRGFPNSSPIHGGQKAVGMTGGGEPTAGFPPPLENAGAFPTFPPRDDDSPLRGRIKNNGRWKSGNKKAKRPPPGTCGPTPAGKGRHPISGIQHLSMAGIGQVGDRRPARRKGLGRHRRRDVSGKSFLKRGGERVFFLRKHRSQVQ